MSARGWSAATTLGYKLKLAPTLKGLKGNRGLNSEETLSGLTITFIVLKPRVVAALQPWANISERFQRYCRT